MSGRFKRVAVLTDERTLTYRELADETASVAAELGATPAAAFDISAACRCPTRSKPARNEPAKNSPPQIAPSSPYPVPSKARPRTCTSKAARSARTLATMRARLAPLSLYTQNESAKHTEGASHPYSSEDDGYRSLRHVPNGNANSVEWPSPNQMRSAKLIDECS